MTVYIWYCGERNTEYAECKEDTERKGFIISSLCPLWFKTFPIL